MVEPGVYAVAPVLDDERGVWMGATLTAPGTFVCRASAGAAYGFWGLSRTSETVVRAGSGGPKRHGGLLVFHSGTLASETTMLGPIPITTPERTLLDLAALPTVSQPGLARALREALRLKRTTLERVVEHLARRRGRRGVARLARTAARYSGLPIARARSGAEVRAVVVLRDAGFVLPALNARIAGEEADLSWRDLRLIVEVDGGPYERPERLLALAAAASVPRKGL